MDNDNKILKGRAGQDKSGLVSALNFAWQKFLLRAGAIDKESRLLAEKIHQLDTRLRVKKVKDFIKKTV